jgi:hypothetical protein
LLKYLLLFLGLCLSGPYTFAQTDSKTAETHVQEEHDTENLDKVFKDYNKDQEKVLKDVETIKKMESIDEISEKEIGTEPESPSNKVFQKKLSAQQFKNKSHYEALKFAFAPLQKLSEAELVALLKEKTVGSTTGQYLQHFPKLALFSVRVIKDPEALPLLGRIVDQQDKLIHFGGVMLCTIILGFLLKRLFKKDGRSVLASLGFWFTRFLILSALRFAILMYFFGQEVEPTLRIAGKTLL